MERYHPAWSDGTLSSRGRLIRHQPAVAERPSYDLRDMPDRVLSRALLAALLLLVTIAGIRAAAPPARIALADPPVVIATGSALEAVLAGLLIALHRRRARDTAPGASAQAAARLRTLLSGTIVTCLIAVPLAMLLTATTKFRRGRPVRPARERTRGTRQAGPHLARPRHGPNFGLDLRYVLIAALVAVLIVAVIVIWRRRHRSAGHGWFTEPPDDTGTPAELARAVDSGRMALRELDDGRAAIIRCYLAMEASLAEAGAARGAAETPDELLARAVAGGFVHDVPAGRLTALFYEARFSTHPMPMSRRDQAEQALAELATALSPAAPATTAASATGYSPGAGPL